MLVILPEIGSLADRQCVVTHVKRGSIADWLSG